MVISKNLNLLVLLYLTIPIIKETTIAKDKRPRNHAPPTEIVGPQANIGKGKAIHNIFLTF